jgi:hypothetical protein
MRKFIAIVLLSAGMGSCAMPAFAQHHGYHGYHNNYYRGGNGWGWVAPAVIGGAVVYGMTRPVIVQQPPVIVQQPNQMIVPYAAPQGFHWEQILDANCNCYRTVLVQG